MYNSKNNHFTRSNIDFNKSSKLWDEALQKNGVQQPEGVKFKTVEGMSGVINKMKKVKISEKKSKFQKSP
jgi:hypothetical protein